MKALLLATAVSAAAFALPGGALAMPVTTVNFSYLDGATVLASGSFSYAEGASGVLGYGDLTDFTVSIGATTYDLADVLPLTDYVWFAYDTASESFISTSSLCGFAGCGYAATLAAINSDGDFGFYFSSLPGPYQEYSLSQTGTFDAIELTPVPEPGSLALIGAGLLGLGAIRRRAAARAG